MKNIDEIQPFVDQLFNMLEAHFGDGIEFILHDLKRDYAHTITDIRNGHITNREIGDCGDNLGLEVFSGNIEDGNRYNYVNYTKDGKTLRSSTLFFRDERDEIIGSICINEDLTKSLELEQFLKKKNGLNEAHKDHFFTDIDDLLDNMIEEAHLAIGKHDTLMTKSEKMEFVKFLDQKGIFRIQKSGEKVCGALNISKYTLYNYLETIRKED